MKYNIGLTGASGMLGEHLLYILSKNNFSVIATSRRPIKNKSININWKRLDLINLKNHSQLDKVFRNIKTIIHIGALVPKYKSNNNKLKIKKINLNSTLILSEWAIKNNIHLIYISGAIVYQNDDKKKLKENSKIKSKFFKDYYGSSKKDCDIFLQKKIKNGKKITILRPSSIYGLGLGNNKIINKLIRLSKLNKLIKLYEPFDKINLIHAYDVANAIFKSIINKKFKTFNVGSNKIYSIYDLSKILIKIIKSKSKIKIVKNVNTFRIRYKYNVSSNEAKKNLDWSPKISIKDGLKLIMEKKYGK